MSKKIKIKQEELRALAELARRGKERDQARAEADQLSQQVLDAFACAVDLAVSIRHPGAVDQAEALARVDQIGQELSRGLLRAE